MKFRRKPVVRDVVDAIRGKDNYIMERDGAIVEVPIEDFDRDYEPAKRDYVKRVRKPRAKKGGEQG